MNVKICKQCGEIKPIEQYRKYYGGRKGTYKVCKSCEKINARAKYLRAKGDSMSIEEERELDKIEQLYNMQRRAGLQPPAKTERNKPLIDSLDDMIAKYKDMAVVESVDDATQIGLDAAPMELVKWLSEPLTADPDYYLDEVYEQLNDTYRPVLTINKTTLMPIYDDTYRGLLDKILDRFTAYEDEYYEE